MTLEATRSSQDLVLHDEIDTQVAYNTKKGIQVRSLAPSDLF